VTPPNTEARQLVRTMLEKAPAYATLEPHERQKLAKTLVDVLAYLSNPNAALDVRGAPQARALADANAALKDRLSKEQDQASKNFKPAASTAGVKAFKDMVSAVDFPKFVSGLVEGVYTSIVQSSIRQMKEYGTMLEGVAKSVGDFAKENISPEEARQFVQKSFPDSIDIDPDSGKLTEKDSGGDAPKPDFKTVLEMQQNLELSEENEAQIVLGAQLKMARQRQQLLAQMVAMGINRIIVTDGEIKASVLFDMKASDTARRATYAQTADTSSQTDSSGGGWFSDGSTVKTTVSSAYSSEADQSASNLEVKAKLSGSVLVKFKSETFPLERLASPQEASAVQQKSAK
jgi:hypothetical protein